MASFLSCAIGHSASVSGLVITSNNTGGDYLPFGAEVRPLTTTPSLRHRQHRQTRAELVRFLGVSWARVTQILNRLKVTDDGPRNGTQCPHRIRRKAATKRSRMILRRCRRPEHVTTSVSSCRTQSIRVISLTETFGARYLSIMPFYMRSLPAKA